jgi:hypothetical protein
MRYSAVILAAVSLGLVCGCAGAPEKESLETKNIEFSEITPLQEGAPYNFTMEMQIEWPEGGTDSKAIKQMQKGITDLLFGSELKTIDIEYAMNAYNSRSVDFYRQNNEEYLEDTEDEWSPLTNWSESINGSFLDEYDGMVSYIKYVHGYSGGAHGMDALTCRTFDLKTGEQILEEDLFKEGYEDKLTAALRINLLSSIEDQDMLFETDIIPSNDFYLTPEGITYIYQRYEIGPYAIGIIEVTVPWSEIKDIIR